ncbi:MAG: hypothetical protein WC887_03255 [Candidatus Paceibacterota bacterium]|jgi:adenine/guanine phosphoribosyltransferase-like PRPP-binding protein
MQTIIPRQGETPLDVLVKCGGYYQCPKDASGKRLGPLVGYAGRDEEGRQFVGDVYVNFAKAERHLPVLESLACELYDSRLLSLMNSDLHAKVTGFCGAPEGGKALAVELASISGKQYIFPEKKVTTAATPNSREISKLVFDRHEPDEGDFWWITEDVCNNFSTAGTMVALIESFGARVVGIVCFLNRSLEVEFEYSPRSGLVLPVLSLVRKKIDQYRQDDPTVADDVRAGNVVWKPKNEWGKLAEAMTSNK